jgi:deazaflavin-dependent oxidoreductase (nitroreductase family)
VGYDLPVSEEKSVSAEAKPIPAGMVPLVKFAMRIMSRIQVWIYRGSGGRLANTFGGAPVCLLTMTGRKTGKRRTIPLIYIPHGDNVLLGASQGGLDIHPIWYHNLVANPEVEIRVGSESRPMRARRATPEEKRQLWPALVAIYPSFDEYQARTDRDIPLLICSPR